MPSKFTAMEQNSFKDKFTSVTSVNIATNIKSRRYDCKWTINNFRLYSMNDLDLVPDSLDSPYFETDGIRWSIDLFPNNSFEDKYVSVRLYYCSLFTSYELCKKIERVSATMSIINRNGIEVCTQKKLFTKDQLVHEDAIFKNFVKKSRLFAENFGLLTNGQLIIKCTILINDSVFAENKSSVVIMAKKRRSIEFDDMEKLLKMPRFNDVEIVVGDRTFQAHKAILSVRSRVFEAMFEHNMKEQVENKIVISDFDAEVIDQLLLFVYSGKVDLDEMRKLAGKLFRAADKYEIEGLKMICELALIENLSVNNAAEALELVDKYGSEPLRKAVFDLLCVNRCHFLQLLDFESVFVSLSPGFLTKVIKTLMDHL